MKVKSIFLEETEVAQIQFVRNASYGFAMNKDGVAIATIGRDFTSNYFAISEIENLPEIVEIPEE